MENNDFLQKAIDELKKAGSDTTASEQVINKTLDRLSRLEDERNRIPARNGWLGFLKLAAAAVILVAAGMYAGRLTRPSKLDASQLAVVEKMLESSIETKLNQDLQKKIEQNFAAFVSENNEQLSSLASSIDDAQQWQQLVIAAVLEQMEQNRQTENEELTNALIDFAAQTQQKLQQTDVTLAKLIGKNDVQNNPEIKKNNLQ